MKLFKYTILTAILLVSFSCKPSTKASKEVAIKVAPEKVMLSAEELQEYETAYFASGCFWCVEAIFESVKGVKEVISGYSGGVKKNPFFGSHDPTTLNRQGPDSGAQYRSVAFYKNETEKKIINDYINLLVSKSVYDSPIVTEVSKFEVFYPAEDYHQDYEKKNPNNSYIRAVSVPRLNRFKENFQGYLKEDAH